MKYFYISLFMKYFYISLFQKKNCYPSCNHRTLALILGLGYFRTRVANSLELCCEIFRRLFLIYFMFALEVSHLPRVSL